MHFVGPQLDDPDWAANDDWRPDSDGPLVLPATSSVFQDQTDVLRRVSVALGQLPVRGLVTTGRAVSPDAVPAPASVRVVRATPQGTVLAETAVVVTHVGHGSVLKALAAARPGSPAHWRRRGGPGPVPPTAPRAYSSDEHRQRGRP